MNITKHCKLTRLVDRTAAGTSDVTSSSVDMQNFDRVCFIVGFGAIVTNAVTSIHVEQSADDSSFADLAGTNIAVADSDDNNILATEIITPIDRYVRVIIDRGTQNCEVDFCLALQYASGSEPVTHSADVISTELHLSPAEGSI